MAGVQGMHHGTTCRVHVGFENTEQNISEQSDQNWQRISSVQCPGRDRIVGTYAERLEEPLVLSARVPVLQKLLHLLLRVLSL